ncbi:phospholipase [Verrucomicrobia bacterium SCGC AG-212-E04]|nr:phospholipase [Verrucomicrobia bacterium SCGC AG-212-E04]
MASRSVIILPDDSPKAILDAVNGAKKSLRIKMFVFSDPDLLKAVMAAKQRGVSVRVMLNPARRNGADDNAESRKLLQSGGVEVSDSNPEFGLTHEKSMVVDDETAFVKSLNWVTENLNETRDYAVITDHHSEVEEIAKCFEADWNRQPFVPPADSHLIWCKGDGRARVAHFIDSVKHTLFVQNERYQDAVIIERIVRAAMRGVKVHVMARPPHTLKKEKLIEGVGGLRIMYDVGVKIHKLKKLRLHGKMLLADGERAIVGSINLAPGSFDDRRELAIEVHDEDVVKRLLKIAEHDWENSHALDLSDEGLMADLAKRESSKAGASGLVLDVDDDEHHRTNHKHRHHHNHDDKDKK